ncbi:MAG TPA: DUF2971 domain-containing protein [Thermoanaerobaculia bacterium]|nr:DUF2971 domain-containing protein [Thermoanaerobaculia bacterium]
MENYEDKFDSPLAELRAAVDVEWSNRSAAPPPVVYHYTSGKAFAGIISSRRLWATISSELNDLTELLHAADVLRSVLNDRAHAAKLPEYSVLYPPQVTTFDFARTDIIEIFVSSLTAAEDDLPQWDRYANRGYGVAIGFHAEALTALHAADGIRQQMGFVEVSYDASRQREFLELFVAAWEHDASVAVSRHLARSPDPLMYMAAWFGNLAGSACAILPRMKSAHFESEREWRLVHAHVPNLPADCEVVTESGTKRHVELDLAQFTGRLPIATVWLGPGVSNDDSERVVRAFLDNQGFTHVKLRRSRVPLRLSQRTIEL